MSKTIPYENAVDLLDGDHKAVKAMFIEYDALCENDAPDEGKQALAAKICQALTVHAQIEEEIFYPRVRKAIGDEALMDHALEEHTQAKQLIAEIQGMKAGSGEYDAVVQQLAKLIDEHVAEEREQIFLLAAQAPLDLRGLAVELFERKKALQAKSAKPAKQGPSAKSTKSVKESA